MKTVMQELLELIPDAREIKEYILENQPDEKMLDEWLDERMFIGKKWLEKEKEQIQKAFSDGQETPLNDPILPHYSREEYYNDKFIVENRFQD